MVRSVGSVIWELKSDCPSTRSADSKTFGCGWLNGAGKRNTRPFPASATYRFPDESTATSVGNNILCALGRVVGRIVDHRPVEIGLADHQVRLGPRLYRARIEITQYAVIVRVRYIQMRNRRYLIDGHAPVDTEYG